MIRRHQHHTAQPAPTEPPLKRDEWENRRRKPRPWWQRVFRRI